ncbi:hypothetical protein [Mycolicibacter minnesotensis]
MPEPLSRSCAAVGIAFASVGMVTIAPIAPIPAVPAGAPAVVLTNAYTDLYDNTMANAAFISQNADWSAMWQVFTQLFTNPFGVIQAAGTFALAVDTDTASLPATIAVQLSPGLELLIAGLASHAATLDAIIRVVEDVSDSGNPFTALLNAPATIVDAHLNGQQNLTMLGGLIRIPVFSGLLAPEQNLQIDLDLTRILDMLGVGNPDLSHLDLDDLIEQVRQGTLTFGGLLSGLGISAEGMGDLLERLADVSSLGDLLDLLGLGDLGLSGYNLTALLGALGLNTDFAGYLDLDVEFDSVRFTDVLGAFGVHTAIPLGLGQLLVDISQADLSDEQLGNLLEQAGLVTQTVNWLTSTAAGVFDPIPLIGPLLTDLVNDLLNPTGLEAFLNTVTVGDLFGDVQIGGTVGSLLEKLGNAVLSLGDLTLGGILTGVGFADSIGDLTLGELLGDLRGVFEYGLLGLDITGLLNGVDVGDLADFFGLDGLSLNLGDLFGDWVNPFLADVLEGFAQGQVMLGSATIGGFGGTVTELLVSMPQQLLAMLAD